MSAAPTGVRTNGIGKPTTAHLNLTYSIADFDRDVALGREWLRRKEERDVQRAKVGYAGRPSR